MTASHRSTLQTWSASLAQCVVCVCVWVMSGKQGHSTTFLPLGFSACLCREWTSVHLRMYMHCFFFSFEIHKYSACFLDCIFKMHSKSVVDIYWMETLEPGAMDGFLFFIFFYSFLIPCLPIRRPILRDARVSKGKVGCWLSGCEPEVRVLIQEVVHKFEESIDWSVLREADKEIF